MKARHSLSGIAILLVVALLLLQFHLAVPPKPDLAAIIWKLSQTEQPGQTSCPIPPEMEEGQDVPITVQISGDLPKKPKNGPANKKGDQTQVIETSSLMEVEMQGLDAFKIFPPPAEDQFLIPGQTTEWKYDVKPISSGKHRLRLLSAVRLPMPNGTEEKNFHTICEPIVMIKPNRTYQVSTFFSKYGQLFIGGAVGVGGTLLTTALTGKKPEQTGTQKGPERNNEPEQPQPAPPEPKVEETQKEDAKPPSPPTAS